MDKSERMRILLDMQDQGASREEIARAIGFNNARSLHKLVDGMGYRFDKATGLCVPKGDNSTTVVTGSTKPITTVVLPVVITEDKQVTNDITISSCDTVTPYNHDSYNIPFNKEDIEILQRVIDEYRVKNDMRSSHGKDKGPLKNRNIRVYEDHYKEFASWCKEHNLIQSDVLYQAINQFMDQYKK